MQHEKEQGAFVPQGGGVENSGLDVEGCPVNGA